MAPPGTTWIWGQVLRLAAGLAAGCLTVRPSQTPHNTRSLATDFWVPYLIDLDSYRVRVVVDQLLAARTTSVC
jgi:hypothetical protein